MKIKDISEKDLYLPVKKFFEENGYIVKAEINHCDLVARRGDSIVVVELKKNLNLDLFLQGIERLSLTDLVYLAFPLPKNSQRNSLWNRKKTTLLKMGRRIGVGLISVQFHGVRTPVVQVHLKPGPYSPRKSNFKLNRLKNEFNSREGDPNLGGSSKQPIVTSYRQEALKCAQLLKMHGPLKISVMKELGAGDKAGNILRDNHYNWFRKKARGIYEITNDGLKGLLDFKKVVKNLEIKPQ